MLQNTRSQYIQEASINIKSFIRHPNIPHMLELWESRNWDTAINLKTFQFIYKIIKYNIIANYLILENLSKSLLMDLHQISLSILNEIDWSNYVPSRI